MKKNFRRILWSVLTIVIALTAMQVTSMANSIKYECSVATIEDQTYTGDAIVPQVSVYFGSLGGIKCAEGIDYTLSYQNNLNVGTASVTITGKGDYSGSKTVYFEITPATLTVEGTTVANKTYDGTTAATVTAGTLEGVIGSDAVSCDVDSCSFDDANAGEDKTVTIRYTLKGPDAGNYRIEEEQQTATIYKKSLSVAGTTVADKTYNGTTAANVDAGMLQGDIIAGDDVKLDTASGTFDDANAGKDKTVTIRYTLKGTDADNYCVSDEISTANITKAAAPKILVNGNEVADGDAFQFTYDGSYHSYSITNNVNIQFTALVFDGTTLHSTISLELESKDAGNHLLIAEIDNANYEKARVKLSFCGNPKTLYVNSTAIAEYKIYDGTTTATVTENGVLDSSGIIGKDSVSIKSVTAKYDDKNVGCNKNVTVTYKLQGAGSNNYVAVTSSAFTANISKKLIEVCSTAIADKVYDGTYAYHINNKGVLSGAIAGDDVTISSAIVVFPLKNADTNKTVHVKYKLSGEDAENYGPSLSKASQTIFPRQLTFTSASASKEYDGTPLTNNFVTITGDGFVEGEGAIFTVTGSQTFVGCSENTFNYSAAPNTKLNNYDITKVYGTLTVTKRTQPLNIIADSASKMYDGTELKDNGYTVTGYLAYGDTITNIGISGSITDAGTCSNTVTSFGIFHIDGPYAIDVTDCYGGINTINGDLTITKRDVTLESGSAVKNYDGTPLTNNTIFVSGDGFITGEGCQYLMGVPGGITNAGSVINSFDYILNAGTKAQNYNITTCYGDLTVNKADLTVSATKDQDVLFGNNGAEIIWNFEGAAYGEEAALAGAPVLDSWTLGSQLVFKGTLTLADNGAFLARNYNMVFENGICVNVYSAEISLADIDFSAYGVYTGSEIKADYIAASYNGKKLVEGTDYEVAYLDNVNAGQGTARIIITGKGCYCGQTVRWFTIAPASVSGWTVSEIANQKYTGYTVTPAVTVSEGEKVLAKDVDYKLTFANNVNAGTATAVVSGIGNYDGKIKKVFIIEKAEGEGEQEVVPTIFDLVKLQKLLSGQTVETGNVNLDVNGDGNIDIFDLVRLKKMIANG